MPTRSKGPKRPTFRHGELHLVVLALLERQPMHGYQIMGELTRLFAPRYRASPGSVYPAIEALSKAGLVAGSDEGGRRNYALTPSGSEALRARLHEVAAIEARTGVRLAQSRDIEDSLDRFVARIRSVAPRVDLEALEEALAAAATHTEQLATNTDTDTTDPSTTTRRIS